MLYSIFYPHCTRAIHRDLNDYLKAKICNRLPIILALLASQSSILCKLKICVEFYTYPMVKSLGQVNIGIHDVGYPTYVRIKKV